MINWYTILFIFGLCIFVILVLIGFILNKIDSDIIEPSKRGELSYIAQNIGMFSFLIVILMSILFFVNFFSYEEKTVSLTSDYKTYREKYYKIIEETSKTAKNIDNYETCVNNTQIPQLCDDIKNDITSILKTDPVKEKLEDNNCFPVKECNIDRYDQSLKDLQKKQASLKASIERYDRIKDIPND